MFDYYQINTVGLPSCSLNLTKFLNLSLSLLMNATHNPKFNNNPRVCKLLKITILDFTKFYTHTLFYLTARGQINYLVISPNQHIPNTQLTNKLFKGYKSFKFLIMSKCNEI